MTATILQLLPGFVAIAFGAWNRRTLGRRLGLAEKALRASQEQHHECEERTLASEKRARALADEMHRRFGPESAGTLKTHLVVQDEPITTKTRKP